MDAGRNWMDAVLGCYYLLASRE